MHRWASPRRRRPAHGQDACCLPDRAVPRGLGDERQAEQSLAADNLVADGLGDDIAGWVSHCDAAEHADARAVSDRDLPDHVRDLETTSSP